jgi:hypothetical protein
VKLAPGAQQPRRVAASLIGINQPRVVGAQPDTVTSCPQLLGRQQPAAAARVAWLKRVDVAGHTDAHDLSRSEPRPQSRPTTIRLRAAVADTLGNSFRTFHGKSPGLVPTTASWYTTGLRHPGVQPTAARRDPCACGTLPFTDSACPVRARTQRYGAAVRTQAHNRLGAAR